MNNTDSMTSFNNAYKLKINRLHSRPMHCLNYTIISVLFGLTGLLLPGCQQEITFQQDPFCSSCIHNICSRPSETLQSHIQSLSSRDQAQFIAIMEQHPGCIQKYEWLKPLREKAYQSYGPAYYAPDQSWYPERGQQAFYDILNSVKNRTAAYQYLSAHASEWQNESWAKSNIENLKKYIEQSDDIFALIAQIADDNELAELSKLDPSPKRDASLIYRWENLPKDTQIRALNAWVSAKWTMQTSGSSQLPQYLTLDWKKRPLPENVPDFIATLNIDAIKINNREVKRREHMLKSAVQWSPLKDPGLRHHRFDLQPWLNTADNYRISAKATIDIWPVDASEACLNRQESCQNAPIVSFPVEYDKQYRVFVGVETGAPRRHKVDADNNKTSQALQLEICSDDNCFPLWDGKKTKDRPVLSIVQGHDFYIKSTANKAGFPVAARLMARQGEGKAWREVAAFFTYAPQAYDVSTRSDIDLGDLCQQTGPCMLELQLRPSLRFARRDPRISRYWGATLELGNITLDLKNQTAKQIWSHFTN